MSGEESVTNQFCSQPPSVFSVSLTLDYRKVGAPTFSSSNSSPPPGKIDTSASEHLRIANVWGTGVLPQDR